MRAVFGQDVRVLQWVADRIEGYPKVLTRCSTIGFERKGGELCLGLVYQNLCRDRQGKPLDVEVTFAADNWGGLFGPGVLRAAFGYPFGQLGCLRITTFIAADNARSLSAVERLGFKHEGTLREAVSPGIDMLVYGMKRDECRFWSE